MSPEEKADVAAIEKFLARAIPRVTLPDFDYKKQPSATPTGGGRREEGREGGRRGRGDDRGPRSGGPAGAPAPGIVRAGAQGGGPVVHGRRPQRGAPDRRRRKM